MMTPDDELHDRLTRAGARWRSEQRPPAAPRTGADGGPARVPGRFAWPAARRWAPVAALVAVLAVTAVVIVPALRGPGLEPTVPGIGTSTASSPGPASGLATLPPDQGQGVPVRGTGVLVRDPNGTTRFCAELDPFAVDRPGVTCGPIAVTVTGVDASVLSHPIQGGGAFSDKVALTGIYRDGTLAIGQARPAAEVPATTFEPAVPCAAPAGGWPLGYGDSNGDTNALIEYIRARPERFADIWQAHPDGAASGPSYEPTRMVYVVGTTGDLAADEATLRSLYSGSLCVHPVKHSSADLDLIAEKLTSISSVAIDARPDIVADGVRVRVIALDEHTMGVLDTIAGGAYVLDPPLLEYAG